MTVVELPVDRLVADPLQPRGVVSAAELDALAADIQARGLLLPLRVIPADADGRHVLVSGHRRYAALLKLGADTAPCVVADGLPDAAAVLAEQLAENLLRQHLSPVEEAAAYCRYLALRDIPAAQAARELHVPPARIAKLLPLLDLPSDVRDRVHRGELAADAGYHLSRLPAGDDRDGLLARAAAGTLTRDQAAAAARRPVASPADAPPVGRVTCWLPGGRSLTVSAASLDLAALIGALEEVLREARKARQQGLDASTLARVLKGRAANGGAA